MPPEQAEGRLEVLDERSDIYSVGAMLYKLLTGPAGEGTFQGQLVYPQCEKEKG